MLACGHDDSSGTGVCPHVRAGAAHLQRFTGVGIEHELVCKACLADTAIERVCRACHDKASEDTDHHGFAGTPGIAVENSSLRFEHLAAITPRVAVLRDLRPLSGADRDRWIGLTANRELVELDLDHDEVRRLATLPEELFQIADRPNLATDVPREAVLTLHVSRDGRLAAVVQQDHGLAGLVIDLETGTALMPLLRDDYCAEHCVHPFAFVEHAGRTLIVHGTDWNRLDVFDPRTRELLTPRGPHSYSRDEERPPHYLDYFHCGLTVSPDQRRIVDNGWVWQPDCVIHTWRLDTWLTENVWESEDGASRTMLCWRSDWDQPLVWIDDTHLALWGYGQDHGLIAGVRIFDVEAAREERWFAGPKGELVFDRVLVSLDPESCAAVWNVERGTRLLEVPGPSPTRYHPTAKTFVRFDGTMIHRSRMLGLDAAYRTGAVADLADRIRREQAFEDLPVLGDALEAAGCTDAEMLAHCQHPGEHGERCWVIERLS